MAATPRPKASDKQAILKKLFPILKKQYKSTVPKYDLPILETLIYAICLENASNEQADAAQEKIDELFHDYNEMRVSSISELNQVFEGMDSPDMRSMRIRSVLHHVFETNYDFQFEALRRKTLDLATKQLNKIRDLSPFVKNFTLQTALGSHLIPIDDVMNRPVKWLGLVEPESKPDETSESLKPVVRKSDGPLFCHLIRCLAHDPKVSDSFDFDGDQPPEEEDCELNTAPNRLKKLLESGSAKKSTKSQSKKTTKSRSSSSKGSGGKNGSAKGKKKSKKSNTASSR